jgi:hypothetical protein
MSDPTGRISKETAPKSPLMHARSKRNAGNLHLLVDVSFGRGGTETTALPTARLNMPKRKDRTYRQRVEN